MARRLFEFRALRTKVQLGTPAQPASRLCRPPDRPTMPKRQPLIEFVEGTKFASLVPWKAANSSQNSAEKDEEVTFLQYWERGNPWIKCRRENGETGLLRTEFLTALCKGAQLEAALATANKKIPGLVQQLRDAKLADDAVADNFVEAPQLPELAEAMTAAGLVNVLLDRIADKKQSLKQLHWALGGETGVLANICNYVHAAMEQTVERGVLPRIKARARGLLTGEAEVGVNSVAARSMQALAKFAKSERFVKHVCDRETVELALKVISDKGNGVHNWKTRSHEKTWSIFLVFAWTGEYISGLALHEEGRKMLISCGAVKHLEKFDVSLEGTTCKDYVDGTLALLNLGKARKSALGRKATKKKKGQEATGHVMISYSYNTKEMANGLKKGLESNGYRVWVDLDKKDGDVMLRMATAVENADIVLMLYSQRYADSRNCNMEVQYVNQLEKPFIAVLCEDGADRLTGDGGRMLNFLRGASLYVDLAKENMSKYFQQQSPSIVQQIGDRGRGSALKATDMADPGLGSSTLLSRIAILEKEKAELSKLCDALATRITALEKR